MILSVLSNPLVLFFVSIGALWGAAQVGMLLRRRDLVDAEREDFGIILGAALTLLGLIIGFSFSMATNRYDERKAFEEEEANAIGTEYVRADVLPAAEAVRVRVLLRDYLDARISFYTADEAQVPAIDGDTANFKISCGRPSYPPLAPIQPR